MKSDSAKTKVSILQIPSLKYGPVRHAMGQFCHILREGGNRNVVGIEEIEISPRCKERQYTLSDGQVVIVTTRKNLQRPKGVDGVLRIANDKSLIWISHRILEQFEKKISSKGLKSVVDEIEQSWKNSFIFQAEQVAANGDILTTGLRPPQIGSLHAIGAHWSLHQNPATVVMPTGTGKTETMVAALVAYTPGKTLVIVPSNVLRTQTASKFLILGLLRSLGNLDPAVPNPIVGIITKRPKSDADLDIFDNCNVLIATMSAIGEGPAALFAPKIAEKVSTLIVDEAHHIGARGWSEFREHFGSKKVLQFTATPYRRDGKLVDGKVIYDYPLHMAQADGYFKHISFEPVYEIDSDAGDRAVAKAAVTRLKADMAAGHNHVMMARCSNIDRAKVIHGIYEKLAPEFQPVIVHSEDSATKDALGKIRSGKSRIVVCVNMLGEGFDLPQLKIAAVHDTHRSLAVLLQFTGRFTRSSGGSIGDATVVANIADHDVSSALERLYSEDADWNKLLSEYSSEAARSHAELVEFLNASERVDEPKDEEQIEISHHLLRPTLSTLVYEAASFNPKRFYEGLPSNMKVHAVWLHKGSDTLYFVTRTEPSIIWTRSRELRDRQWDLFVLHYESKQKLLYLSSTDHSSLHDKMATAVGATKIVSGDTIFRTLGRINRLIFQNIGVRKHGRRNLRYALYTGADVATALSISETAGSVKSNLSGSGWENGKPVTIGCSYKGRIWSRESGSIPEFVHWSGEVGAKLQDSSIDTAKIIANVLVPEEVNALPAKEVLSVEWPLEILKQSEDRITLSRSEEEAPISLFDIVFGDGGKDHISFLIKSASDEEWVALAMAIGGDDGFKVTRVSKTPVYIRVGNLKLPIEDYFSNYPPLVRFVDLSELDGNLLIKPQSTQTFVFPEERLEVWDWNDVDLKKESIWKNHTQREDSIQWKAANQFIAGGYEVVFDDDSSGEAADLVCLKEEKDFIRMALIHCKATKAKAGERVKDVVEVSSQAVRSAKWRWKFRDLCKHVITREKLFSKSEGRSRFLAGNSADLNRFLKTSRFKEVRADIIIVQPGLSCKNRTSEQVAVLASADSYLKETIGVELDVICSP